MRLGRSRAGVPVNQVSPKLRRSTRGFIHWCPACEEPHMIFDSWKFDGNLASPTFEPSVKIDGKQAVVVDGLWTGEWVRDAHGKPLDYCCHYVLTAGVLAFCGDSTHRLANQSVPLPDLPEQLRDPAPEC